MNQVKLVLSWFVGCLLVLLYVPANLIGMFLLLTKYRNHVIFAKRGVALVSIEVLSLMIGFLIYSLKAITEDTKLDTLALYLYYLFGLSALCAVFLRLVMLYLALTVCDHVKSEKRLSIVESWWKRHRKYFTARNISIGVIAVLVLALSILTFMIRQNPEIVGDNISQGKIGLQKIYIALFYWTLGGCASVYMIYLLRNTGQENFGIKHELKFKAFSGLLVVLGIFIGLAKRVKEFSVTYVDVRMVITFFAAILETYFAVWKVIFDIWHDLKIATEVEMVSRANSVEIQQQQQPSPGGSAADIWKMTLDDILGDLEFLCMFTEFLCRELSIEHLLFIQQVNVWKTKWSATAVEERKMNLKWEEYVNEAADIYMDFLDPAGLAPVNISFNARKGLKEAVSALQHHSSQKAATAGFDTSLFDVPYVEVRKLLNYDSLARFRRDTRFKLRVQQMTHGQVAVSVQTKQAVQRKDRM